MTDNRAEELSGRWGNSGDDDGEQADSQIDEQASKTNRQTGDEGEQVSKTNRQTGDEGEQVSKTNRRIGEEDEQVNKSRKLTTRERESQMVYLRPDQYERIHGAWLDLEYRFGRKRGIDLEKSRDFLVPLLELGLAQLGDVESRDLDELADLLDIEDE